MSAKRSLLCTLACVVALLACLVPPAAPVSAAGLPYAINLTLDRTSQVVSNTLGSGEGVKATVTVVDSAGTPVSYTGIVTVEFSGSDFLYGFGDGATWGVGKVPLNFMGEGRKWVMLTTPQAGEFVVTARTPSGDLVSARSRVTFTAAQPVQVGFERSSTDLAVAAPSALVTARLLDQFGNVVRQEGLGIQVTPMRGDVPTGDLQVNNTTGAHTWQTAPDGTVGLSLSGRMVYVGSNYTLSAMPAAGGAATTHTVRVLNSLPQTVDLSFWKLVGGAPAQVGAAVAGDPVLIKIRLRDAMGYGVTGYAGALALNFGAGQWATDAAGLSRIRPGDRVAVQDDGNGDYSVTLFPTATGILTATSGLNVNGTPVAASASLNVRAAAPAGVTVLEVSQSGGATPEVCLPSDARPITLQLTDPYGNAVTATAPVTLQLNSDQTQFQFRTGPLNLPMTQATIPAGASSITEWIVSMPGRGSASITDAAGRLTGFTFNYVNGTCVSMRATSAAVVGDYVWVEIAAKGVKALKGWSADVRFDSAEALVDGIHQLAVAPVTYAPIASGWLPGLAYNDSSLLYPTQPGVDGDVALFRVSLRPKAVGRITLRLSDISIWGATGVLPTGHEDLTIDVLAAPPLPAQPVIDSATKLPNSRSVTLQFHQPPAPQTAYVIYRHPGLATFVPGWDDQVGMTVTGQFTDETLPQDGDYTWEARAMNLQQVVGPLSTPVMLVVDSVPPQLTVSGPSTVTASAYQFRVTTDGMLPLLINGTPVYPAADGTVAWQLKGGTNGLTVRAMDQAGNYAERVLMVTYMVVGNVGPARTWTSTADFQTGTLTGLSAAGDELKLAAGARTGTWTARQDSGALRTRWTQLTWAGLSAAGGTVVIKTRTADDPAQLSSAAWAPLGTNGTITSAPGRYIEVKVDINANLLTGRAPVVQSVTVNGVKSTR